VNTGMIRAIIVTQVLKSNAINMDGLLIFTREIKILVLIHINIILTQIGINVRIMEKLEILVINITEKPQLIKLSVMKIKTQRQVMIRSMMRQIVVMTINLKA
jgi:hypothetical protein